MVSDKKKSAAMSWFEEVLILVLMEYGLWQVEKFDIKQKKFVS